MSDPRDEPGGAVDGDDARNAEDVGDDDAAAQNDGADAEDGDWRFSLSDLDDAGGAEQGPQRPPIEPGSPSVENAAFVLLGVVLTLWVLFGGL